MKDVSKTLSIAAVVALVSAAGVTIAQTSDSVPNSNSPNAASSPYVAPTTSNTPSTSALPTNEGTSSQTENGSAATPTLEQRQEGSGSMGSRNTPDTGASSSTDPSSSSMPSTVDNSGAATSSPSSDSSSSSELPARADRG